MLSLELQINISANIFSKYKNKNTKNKTLSQTNFLKNLAFFNFRKFESYDKKSFALLCIYVIFKSSPSTLNTLLKFINEYDKKELEQFILSVNMHQSIIMKDVEYLNATYIIQTTKDVFHEYRKKNINAYTVWCWYLIARNIDVMVDSEIKSSRVDSELFKKISFLMSYITLDNYFLKSIMFNLRK